MSNHLILASQSDIKLNLPSPEQALNCPLFEQSCVRVFVKRDDLIHPEIAGNKWRKLKHNLLVMQASGVKQLVTFGGAFSNHIAATAAAGKDFGIQTIGIIRGEATSVSNPTLRLASENGMTFQFVSREEYKRRNDADYLAETQARYPSATIIPEGGSNELALEGMKEMLDELEQDYDYIACACGSGGTSAGILKHLPQKTTLISVPVLKNGEFLRDDINQLAMANADRLRLETAYHFGGYAKINAELIGFKDSFETYFGIPLEPIYTAKLFYGVVDLIKKKKISSGSKVLVIHSGGLQGNLGMADKVDKIRNNALYSPFNFK